MLILTLRTDKPDAEIGLYDNETQITYETWQAHRQLAETIHTKIAECLKRRDKTVQHIQGIVFYKGPGSFTGLRIGASVANAVAYSLRVPILATTGDTWQASGIEQLKAGKNDKTATLEYGAPVHITVPKK